MVSISRQSSNTVITAVCVGCMLTITAATLILEWRTSKAVIDDIDRWNGVAEDEDAVEVEND